MMDIEFENRLRSTAKGMEYPPTPDVTGSVMTRLHSFPSPSGRGERDEGRSRFVPKRLAWSLAIVLVLLSSLMLIPPVRAAIVEFIQIGIVRIFPQPVTPTFETITTATPQSIVPPPSTPGESSSLLIPFLNQIAGETKLANAQGIAPYPILLPTYPADLSQPNHVYIQDAEGTMTILVWVDPGQPERVTMSLHFIPEGSWAIKKFNPVVIHETAVNGQRAVWTEGPYPLILRNGNIEFTRLVEGYVLIWAEGDVTYRLETDLPLEEALKIAESLEPIP
jgi:hypothetical protein